MNKICGIYKITSPSNRIYIGQSINIKRRFKEYKTYNLDKLSQPRLIRSFKKYGRIAHIFEIIEECAKEKLNERERYWQEYYEVLGRKGLNCSYVETEDYQRIITEETRLKMSEAHLGKKLSDETKEKMRLAHKGEKAYWYGKKLSEETRNKMSKATKGIKKSEEFIMKQKGRKQIQMTCPHCGKVGGSFAMKRWHFDNCEFNENKNSLFKITIDEFNKIKKNHNVEFYSFKEGIKFTESKIEELAVEFLIWIEKDYLKIPFKEDYVRITTNQEDWPYNFSKVSRKELFNQFLKERNETKI